MLPFFLAFYGFLLMFTIQTLLSVKKKEAFFAAINFASGIFAGSFIATL